MAVGHPVDVKAEAVGRYGGDTRFTPTLNNGIYSCSMPKRSVVCRHCLPSSLPKRPPPPQKQAAELVYPCNSVRRRCGVPISRERPLVGGFGARRGGGGRVRRTHTQGQDAHRGAGGLWRTQGGAEIQWSERMHKRRSKCMKPGCLLVVLIRLNVVVARQGLEVPNPRALPPGAA